MDGRNAVVSFVVRDGIFPTLEQVRDAYVELILEKTKGKKTAAARILGINRRTLYRRKKT